MFYRSLDEQYSIALKFSNVLRVEPTESLSGLPITFFSDAGCMEKSQDKKDQYASNTQEMEMDRSRFMYGTKLKPTCDTNLGTKWKRKRGRPREKWRRTVERECAEMKLTTRATATAMAKNRDKWGATHFWPYPRLEGL